MTVIQLANGVLQAIPDRWPIPLPATAILAVAISMSVNTWVAVDKAKTFFVNLEPSQCRRGDVFDYIVVGAGGAGMIVATRLANASLDQTVLLLEAGGEPSILNELPILGFSLASQPANAWIYKTPPQRYACGICDGQRILTTRGKMLGGSTSLNFMMYVRGNKEDYNRWGVEDLGGDPQWSYESLLPYFKKSEDYHGAHRYSPDADIYHGKGGLLNVGTYDYMPGGYEFIDAARERGYRVGDYNGADQEVFSPLDVTTQNGWRESTYRAFYRDTVEGCGVTYMRHQKETRVLARREVILSAGAIETPKLLLLSGVGPADELIELNIPVVVDLPVGKHLQDHLITLVGPFFRSPSLNPNRDITPQAIAKFIIDGSGSIAAPAALAGIGFLQSPFATPSYPDLNPLQFTISLYPELGRDVNQILGLNETIMNGWVHPYQLLNTDARFVLLALGRPKSVGSLRLVSTNPEDNPILDPRYLEHPDDVEALLFGFKKMVDLFENTSALNYTSLFPRPVPSCEYHEFKSDSYYRCAIRQLSTSYYHHVGTCALGKVVDANLRVKGILGLRIIDASIIPRLPNGNTQAPTFAVAEKGAELVITEKI